MDDKNAIEKPTFLKRKAALKVTFCVKKTRDATHKKISAILRKAEHERTEEESQFLCSGDNIVQEVKEKLLKRQRLKERSHEFEDPSEVLSQKCALLAKAISQSKHLVVYTGAGISTAARIPDYRGTNGVWTLLEQGKDIGLHDFSRAKPTLTHMALFRLYQKNILKHIVSQNCDGLHLRSGLPRSALSEIHGNMFLEVCHDCEPIRFYLRLFDVTQHTARYSHETLRLCYYCGSPLCDTIVHFGERGVLQWPLNWKTASDNANQADVILCLGSSLKVLKKYPWLWGMDKPLRKRPQLYIVNLQWTPKDEHATLKINGKCDTVLQQVMDLLSLGVPKYSRLLDPIYNHATLIHPAESHITSKPSLKFPLNQFADLSPDNHKFLFENSQQPLDPCNQLEIEKIKVKPSSVKSNGSDELDLVMSVKSDDSYVPSVKMKEDSLNKSLPNNFEVLVNMKSENSFVPLIKMEEEVCVHNSASAELDVLVSVKSNESYVPIMRMEEEVCADESVIVNSIILKDRNFDLCEVVKEEDVWDTVEECNENLTTQNGKQDGDESFIFDYELAHFESVDLAIGAVETVGISIPADEFDEMYWKIHNNLIAESKTTINGGDSFKDKSVILSDNICDTRKTQDTHPMKKTDRFNNLSSSDKETNAEPASSSDKAILSQNCCNFCFVHYDSSSCLFYTKFTNINPNFKERCCLCCEDSKDSAAKERVNSQLSINPGWFGKGYRKKIKKKKRD